MSEWRSGFDRREHARKLARNALKRRRKLTGNSSWSEDVTAEAIDRRLQIEQRLRGFIAWYENECRRLKALIPPVLPDRRSE